MSWWLSIIEYLRNAENGNGNGQFSIKRTVVKALAENAIDLLFYIVGFFTTLYFFMAAYLFFGGGGNYHDVAIRIFNSLSEPYLGSVGIYVILKEIRKRYQKTKSRHPGEYFVLAWLSLFLIAISLVIFTYEFAFDELMSAITTVSMAIAVIFMGGVINKP